MDDSAQSQELREDDNSASEITYGEVEQRLGQLQDHLNRYVFLQSPCGLCLFGSHEQQTKSELEV